jgi:hypothetical protein
MMFKMLAVAMMGLAVAGCGRQLLKEDSPKPAVVETVPTVTSKVAAKVVPTFHCLSLYWSPAGGEANKKVLVKFREAGQGAWRDGFSLRHNPVDTKECKGDYRGSLVNLKPGTAYEILLMLEGTDERTSIKANTWSEKFPVAETVKVPSGAQTVEVKKSGTAEGYVVYDGTGSTIDCANKSEVGISVNASYVILRGFTIKNVKEHGIRIFNGNHIVIEGCDISKWGSEEEQGFGFDYQAAVYTNNRKDVHTLVIQRNKFHHPSWDSNSWAEDHHKGKPSRHPSGPQTIVFWENEGNNVIRYNECWSDPDHYYNDILGGGNNGSYRGFPGADSDIYCNYIAHCWDDGIESEGGNQNVRIWNNYIEHTMIAIGNAATSIGPLYVWRNVSGHSETPKGSSWDLTHGGFMKMGFADGEKWMTGHMYVFNNTILQPDGKGNNGLGGESRALKHVTTRNNILHVRPTDTHVIARDKRHEDNDFDHDLISAERFPDGAEKNGIKGVPKYVEGAGFSFETRTGNFQLAPDSPGFDKGVVIPNFSDVFNGAGPDMGAHEAGTPPMVYGVKAEFVPAGAGK